MTAATTGLGIRATAVKALVSRCERLTMSVCDIAAISLTSAPGREDPLAAVDDHRLDVVALRRLVGDGPDLLLHLRVEGVHLGPVEADGAHPVGDLETDELTHDCSCPSSTALA